MYQLLKVMTNNVLVGFFSRRESMMIINMPKCDAAIVHIVRR